MINYEFPPIGGGTGNACYYMLKEFSGYPELHVDLVTFSPDNASRVEHFADNVDIYYVKCGKKKALHYWKTSELMAWLFHTWRFLSNHCKVLRYDLIHCWSGWPAGIIGYRFREVAPYIVALRGSDVPGHTPRTALLDALVMRRLSQRVWRNAAAITSVSNHLAALARKTANCPFQIINNGIDTKEFFPSSVSGQHPPLRLLYVGRLNPHKGVDDLLEALRLLAAELEYPLANAIRLTIVGGGSLSDVLAETAQANGLADAIEFKGIVPHESLPAIYREHDVFVFPCHSDAMANVILEATASGLAIICTNTGGSELVSDNGFIINIRDPQSIKDKLSLLVSSPGRVEQMKQRSIALAKSMGWDACCKRYHDLYKSVLSEQS